MDSKANPAPGENPCPATTLNDQYQYNYHDPHLDLEQSLWLEEPNDSYYNSSWISQILNQQPSTPQHSTLTPPTNSGALGRVGSKQAKTAENMSQSPPPLLWSSCSMFMVAPDHWTDGGNNKSDIIGEQQLNTPEPSICGFDFDGSLAGLDQSENPRSAISKNHINNSSSITMMNGKESNTSVSMHGSKGEQPFEIRLDSTTSPTSFLPTADVNTSWQFERCPEDIVFSPEMSYHMSPLQTTSGVASPDSSSGVSPEVDDFETCVDIIKIPSTAEVYKVNENTDYSTSLTEETEQLSESYYCKAEDLISIQDTISERIVTVPPFFLKVLREEESNTSERIPPQAVSNGTVYDTRPSVATEFLCDAYEDEEDYDDELGKAGYDVAGATAKTLEAVQSVSSNDDTLDLKTQTQLEHNYTIKLPLLEADKSGPILTTSNALVKEPSLKPRDTSPVLPLQQQPPKRAQPPSMKQQLFERTIKNEIAKGTKLKLKIPTAGTPIVAPVGILNTPDLTNQVLELEAEAEILSAEDQFDLLQYISSGTYYDVVPLSPVEVKPVVPKEEPVQPPSTICTDTLTKLLSGPAKRKAPPMITLDNLEELTSSSTPKKFRSATSSSASSVYEDSISESASASASKKRRGRPPKQSSLQFDRAEYQHLSEQDQRYREQRDKNNEASRKSRINRRDRELKLEHEANALNQHYRELENEEQKLIRDCARWRRAVMRLALL